MLRHPNILAFQDGVEVSLAYKVILIICVVVYNSLLLYFVNLFILNNNDFIR